MLKTITNFIAGALVASAVATAFAVTGNVPQPGFQAVDGSWLLGLSGGTNFTYQSGITAHAGGGQTSCLSLNPGIALYQVDTVASGSDSVCIPFAVAGTDFQIRNNGAQALAIYGQAANNLLTGAADTINGTAGSSEYNSSTGLIANNSIECFAAKNGAWSCVSGH